MKWRAGEVRGQLSFEEFPVAHVPGGIMAWSPDSRYLLAFKWLVSSGPETYSLEKIDMKC